MTEWEKIDKSFALKLLRSFFPQHLLEEIEGDLLQKFERDLKLHFVYPLTLLSVLLQKLKRYFKGASKTLNTNPLNH